MKRLLMIVHSYPPAGGSGMFRNFKFSKFLLEYGWHPFVSTLHIKYSEKIDNKMIKEVPAIIEITRSRKFDIVTSLAGWKKWFEAFLSRFFSPGNVDKKDLVHEKGPRLSERKKSTGFIKSIFWFPDRYAGWIFPAL